MPVINLIGELPFGTRNVLAKRKALPEAFHWLQSNTISNFSLHNDISLHNDTADHLNQYFLK
jgi:hypothetical protein